MKRDFKNKHYRELYETGKSKKLKFDKNIIKKFILRVNMIDAAVSINDLRKPPSNEFEGLEGFKNRFSIRLNNQYRLIFDIDFENAEKTVSNVLIIEISKHYESKGGRNG